MRRHMRSARWALAVGLLLAGRFAAPARSAAEDLVQAAEGAKQAFQAVTSEQVVSAKQALEASLDTLDRKLNRNPREIRDGWHAFLLCPASACMMCLPQPCRSPGKIASGMFW